MRSVYLHGKPNGSHGLSENAPIVILPPSTTLRISVVKHLDFSREGFFGASK